MLRGIKSRAKTNQLLQSSQRQKHIGSKTLDLKISDSMTTGLDPNK